MLWAWTSLRQLVLRSKPLTEVRVAKAMGRAAKRLSSSAVTSTVYVTGETGVPVAVGVLRPRVLLPVTWNQLTDEQLTDVLVHELTHLARRDPVKLLFQHVASALYWPIISVHFVNSWLNAAREEVCDNSVLKNRNAIAYGETLFAVATLVADKQRPSLASSCFLRKECNLERRVTALLAQR